jgi:hypothetical protein
MTREEAVQVPSGSRATISSNPQGRTAGSSSIGTPPPPGARARRAGRSPGGRGAPPGRRGRPTSPRPRGARRPGRALLVVPSAAFSETCADVGEIVGKVICARTPERFVAVGLWYHDLTATSDEVRTLLENAVRTLSPRSADLLTGSTNEFIGRRSREPSAARAGIRLASARRSWSRGHPSLRRPVQA